MSATLTVPGAATVMTSRPVKPSRALLCLTLASTALLRLGIHICTNAADSLQDRPELSTPIGSFKALMETHYLFQHPPTHVSKLSAYRIPDPYSAGTIHHSPLLLPVLNHALQRFHTFGDALPVALVWTAADVVAGWSLFRICSARESSLWTRQTHLWTWDQSRALKVAAIFLFNPFTVATSIARSSTSLEAAALLAAIHAAMSGMFYCVAGCHSHRDMRAYELTCRLLWIATARQAPQCFWPSFGPSQASYHCIQSSSSLCSSNCAVGERAISCTNVKFPESATVPHRPTRKLCASLASSLIVFGPRR